MLNGYIGIVSDVTSSAKCEAAVRPTTQGSVFAGAVAECSKVRQNTNGTATQKRHETRERVGSYACGMYAKVRERE